MNLTKQQAIYEHRKMWNWIAGETLKRKEKVTQKDYFLENMDEYPEVPTVECWCCEYSKEDCEKCSVIWGDGTKGCVTAPKSPLTNWFCETNYKKAAEYARKIAELPEKNAKSNYIKAVEYEEKDVIKMKDPENVKASLDQETGHVLLSFDLCVFEEGIPIIVHIEKLDTGITTHLFPTLSLCESVGIKKSKIENI